MTFVNVLKPVAEEKYLCPCCGFRTLMDRGGFGLCPVCNWEDDGQDERDTDEVRGGPNGNLSLTQARLNFKVFAVSDPSFISSVRKPLDAEKL